MQRTTIFAILAALLVAAGAFLAWSQVAQLGEQVSGLNGQVTDLGERLADSEQRAGEAESRAAEATARADRAEEEADEAARQAEAATEREQESARQAEAAEAARQDAEARQRQAAADRRDAELAADEAAAARAAAEERRAAAERREAESILQAEAAREEARRVRLENDRIRRRMERELNRLERALGRIADTRRTALGLVMTLDSKQIEFDFDKSELRPHNREVLSRITGVLLTFQDYGIQVFGHTDDVGTVDYNQTLSEQRAEAVRDYLVEAGVDAAILSTMGLGKTSPLVEGTDPEARQRNRRVELAIVFSEGEYEAIQEEPAADVPAPPPG